MLRAIRRRVTYVHSLTRKAVALLSKLRTRLTFANVVSMLALFVALGGSSYAAVTMTGRNVKDSSLTGRDIKNSSLTTSDVKNGSLRSTDFNSGQLPAGPRGAQGPEGNTGDQGDQGDQGVPGPFPAGDLPSGNTIRGAFAAGGGVDTTADYVYGDISYGFRLASPPTKHFIKDGAAAPPECAGSPDQPEAAPGHLCAYESFSVGASANRGVSSPGNTSLSDRYGSIVYLQPAGDGDARFVGTWAVTAP